MAVIVAAPGGEVYAPLFERLEQELENLDRRQSVVARARALVKSDVIPRRGRATPPDAAEWDPSRS